MTTKRQDSNYMDLCKFQFADGRLCSLPGIPSLKGYCRSHAALNRPPRHVEEDLSAELSSITGDPCSGLNVYLALERVFMALAANRISTRRAATFGYLAQLILASMPGAHKQTDMKIFHAWRTMVRDAYPDKVHARSKQPDPPSS